jgi:hypothetical protein
VVPGTLVALVLAVFSVAAEEEKAGVTIIINTDQTVALALTGDVFTTTWQFRWRQSHFSVDRQVLTRPPPCGLGKWDTDPTKVPHFTPEGSPQRW